jgi:hypothetical protein
MPSGDPWSAMISERKVCAVRLLRERSIEDRSSRGLIGFVMHECRSDDARLRNARLAMEGTSSPEQRWAQYGAIRNIIVVLQYIANTTIPDSPCGATI